MLVLVPGEHTQPDYAPNEAMISLARLMRDNEREVQLLTVHHQSDLRLFLNRNDLLGFPTWDVLDHALGIKITEGRGLGLSDVPLPHQAELIQTISGADVMVDDELVKQIFVNEMGLVTRVETNWNGGLKQVQDYDERGFILVERMLDQQEKVLTQKWFDEYGHVVLEGNQRQLLVQPIAKSRFERGNYPDLEAVLTEVMIRHVTKLKARKAVVHFIANPSQQNAAVLVDLQRLVPVNLLVTANQVQDPTMAALFMGAHQIFVAGNQEIIQLRDRFGQSVSERARIGYPYATDLRLGNSAASATQKIIWSVGQLESTELAWQFDTMDLSIHQFQGQLTVVNCSDQQTQQLAKLIISRIRQNYPIADWFETAELTNVLFNSDQWPDLYHTAMAIQETLSETDEKLWQDQLGPLYAELAKFHLEPKLTKSRAQSEMGQARLLIDLSESPVTYLQVAAISAGVPQLNRVKTPYLQPGQNGRLVQTESQLKESIAMYISQLNVWNEALVANVQLIPTFTSDQILAFWEESLNGD
ncbi:accessory Sec system protein Asp1 [Levilactobacillus bambusae]|uniref:Accessory Sec system protein Asp1 n=1 Tax=Levilactobacillus bambusae TaxID=2024736 RepID=A0A2V1MYT0_9LACO|nr:accessory Sec system protein Asp1 [Levilactobacillus bambusae]PWF99922.1 accessory Sec system protein Asp1 [Levilactobacillus bambusae]